MLTFCAVVRLELCHSFWGAGWKLFQQHFTLWQILYFTSKWSDYFCTIIDILCGQCWLIIYNLSAV